MLTIGILVLVLMGGIRKELGIKMMSRLSILILIGALMLKYNIYISEKLCIDSIDNNLTIFNGLLRIDTLGIIEIFIYIAAVLLLALFI